MEMMERVQSGWIAVCTKQLTKCLVKKITISVIIVFMFIKFLSNDAGKLKFVGFNEL